MIDYHAGKVQSSNDPNIIPGGAVPFGRLGNAKESDRIPPGPPSSGRILEAENSRTVEDKGGSSLDQSMLAEDKKPIPAASKVEVEIKGQETADSLAGLPNVAEQTEFLSTRGSLASGNPTDNMENGNILVGRGNLPPPVMSMNKQMNSEMHSWTGIGGHDEVLRRPFPASTIQRELLPERKDNVPGQFQSVGNRGFSGNQLADGQLSAFSMREHWKSVPATDNGHHAMVPINGAGLMSKPASHGLYPGNIYIDTTVMMLAVKCFQLITLKRCYCFKQNRMRKKN